MLMGTEIEVTDHIPVTSIHGQTCFNHTKVSYLYFLPFRQLSIISFFEAPYIILSDVSCLVMAYCLASVGQIYGFWNLFVFWGIPYLATNFLYVF